MKASTAQARLLAALEQHASRDEEVYVSTNDCPPSLVMVVAHAAGHGPLFGVDMFLEVDHELPALVPASLPRARVATVQACARRGWLADGGVDELEVQRSGVRWFPARTIRLRRILPTERGAAALQAWRQASLERPVPLPPLEGEERELVAIALRAERLGFAVVPVSAEAKRAARALARGPWARRGWGGGASTRSLLATAMGEVELDPGSADRVPA